MYDFTAQQWRRGGQRSVQIQDPVHGLMEFTGASAIVGELLDLPEIDRLHHLRQLDLVAAVFPGAEHSRRQHAIGAAYLAHAFGHQIRRESQTRVPDVLLPDEEMIRDLVVAALVQNIGHAPFSTALEAALFGAGWDSTPWVDHFGLDRLGLNVVKRPWHEVVALALICTEETKLHRKLAGVDHDLPLRVARLLTGQAWPGYLNALLRSEIDVDRMDFLARDALFAGVTYGKIDIPRMRGAARLAPYDPALDPRHAEDPEGAEVRRDEVVLMFDGPHGATALEQMLLGRTAMYRSVYHHRSVTGAQVLLTAIIQRTRDMVEHKEDLGPGLDPCVEKLVRGEVLRAHEILSLTDGSILGFVGALAERFDQDSRDPDLGDLAGRFIGRRWFRLAITGKTAAAIDADPALLKRVRDAVVPKVSGTGDRIRGDDHVKVHRVPPKPLFGPNPAKVFIRQADGATPELEDSLFVPAATRKTPRPDGGGEDELRVYVPDEAVQDVQAVGRTIKEELGL